MVFAHPWFDDAFRDDGADDAKEQAGDDRHRQRSFRQGVALARAAAERGAEVVLVAAHIDGDVASGAAHPGVEVRRARTTAELADAVQDAAASADVVVMAAAVADYRPAEAADRKLTKESSRGRRRMLELVETEDVLKALVGGRRPGQTIVGFAAETAPDRRELLERGRRKAARKGADLLAVNEVGWTTGFETPDNAVLILSADGALVAEASGTKREVADALWDTVISVRGTEQ
ncbi:MAG: hypothetical protein J0I62_04765 [Microbacterium sp.]|nr:hypothetical protein [Microbacterium sp.]